jgi:hypothetical protein
VLVFGLEVDEWLRTVERISTVNRIEFQVKLLNNQNQTERAT